MKNLLLSILTLCLLSLTAQGQTQFGYNNSRIVDQLTDERGELIPERVQSLVDLNIPVMRFPGGTVARNYHIAHAGYDGRGKLYGGLNAVYRFIPVVKQMKASVVLVLNVGHYDTFFWNINPDSAGVILDRNRRLIQTFIDSGVPIWGVEVGNEEYLHIPKGAVLPPTWSYNFIQRLFGQPQRDARLREEVLGYYRMYSEIYKVHAELIDSFGLKAIVPMVNNSNFKWTQWNEAVKDVKAEYGVWHHYESNTNANTWQPTIDSYLSAIRAQGRKPVCTEFNWWFGDQGTELSRVAASDGTMNRYNSWLKSYAIRQKIELMLKHRINGDPAMRDGGGVPYDFYRVD
jgi:hypothetical protein